MRVGVVGLWHLGCVTAACLAGGGHDVIAIDSDSDRIAHLRNGQPPLFEPGLAELVQQGLASGRLRFVTETAALAGAELVWITFDTPVDDNDVPQPSVVVEQVSRLVPHLADNCLVLISAQLPVGTTRHLAETAAAAGKRTVTFGYSPENLRLGQAIDVFTRPDRVVVGLQSEADRSKVAELLAPFTQNLIWMGVESAEMTKHAINAFLANSIVFMNEIAAICEGVGANAKDVERGLKSERRIGPSAYLSPGAAFEGGTLARDVTTLAGVAHRLDLQAPLVAAIRESNEQHRSWALRKLTEKLGALSGRRVSLLGLTYKPGTSTLRRSGAVALATALQKQGAVVAAFDPAIEELPAELAGVIALARSAADALARADAVVLTTPWPAFRELDWPALLSTMARPIVVDANGFLFEALSHRPGIAYAAVGFPWTG